tara:strand:- start:1038 stop:1220 length:183 start_codon:yes stop_codon:yes gene_type:complete
MKDDFQSLSDSSIRMAITYDSKEIAATKLGEYMEAENHRLIAKHHRNESKKYLQEMKDYE